MRKLEGFKDNSRFFHAKPNWFWSLPIEVEIVCWNCIRCVTEWFECFNVWSSKHSFIPHTNKYLSHFSFYFCVALKALKCWPSKLAKFPPSVACFFFGAMPLRVQVYILFICHERKIRRNRKGSGKYLY